ncbi:MAG TPA: helix-turn-helix transcriptional regulator [Acidimicrobiales bacterium]|nr:helix-turn-helix transcriptional regulator [Acidimicrobiales bacterium]
MPAPAVCKEIRRSAGVSLQSLGDALGVSRAAVDSWERGLRRPNPEHIGPYLNLLRALTQVVTS